jgi:hypothetical protein
MSAWCATAATEAANNASSFRRMSGPRARPRGPLMRTRSVSRVPPSPGETTWSKVICIPGERVRANGGAARRGAARPRRGRESNTFACDVAAAAASEPLHWAAWLSDRTLSPATVSGAEDSESAGLIE